MKCDELKAHKGDVTIPVYGTIADAQVYLKEDVDALLAKKDEEIRRLNYKYWSDKADEAAKMKRLIYDGKIIYLDEYCNEKDWRIMRKVWEDEEIRCRAKAEEYNG